MYFAMTAVISFVAGYTTNCLLMPGFEPVLDFDRTSKTISAVNKMLFELPTWAQNICSFIVIGYAMVAFYRYLKQKMKKA